MYFYIEGSLFRDHRYLVVNDSEPQMSHSQVVALRCRMSYIV
jgi:hypothetical protein